MFREAADRAPEARVYQASAVLAAASLQNWTETNERWSRTQYQWRDDVRFGLISALLGIARRDLDEAEMWLRTPAAENETIAEQFYYVLLWNGRFADAESYAARQVEALKRLGGRTSIWLERSGDALFFERSYVLA